MTHDQKKKLQGKSEKNLDLNKNKNTVCQNLVKTGLNGKFIPLNAYTRKEKKNV